MKVIVNADDLGMSHQANEAIFSMIGAARLSSATIMANGQMAAAALQQAKRLVHCSFGVHLNISEFKPLTRQPELAPLLNNDGCLDHGLLYKACFTRSLRLAVFREWSAQIESVRSSGLQISHLDSHHHTHTLPKLFVVFKRVQRRFGIRKARISFNIFPSAERVSRLRLAKKTMWNLALRYCYHTVTTEGFASLKTFLGASPGTYGKFCSVELVVHPGHPSFDEETRLLHGTWWNGLPVKIDHINYKHL